ncbi:hypothetical protein BH11CYA1_BH11CYA1_07260 [soil metagenome]
MSDLHRAETKLDNGDKQSNDKEAPKPLSVTDIDMKDFRAIDREAGRAALNGFNHIETSTFDLVANKDDVITKAALKKAADSPALDEVQKDDVQHMLTNFALLRDQVKDGGKGISREDIAKYNFPHDINHIEDSTVAKLTKAGDGTITKDGIAEGLKRTDLSDIERDDLQYLQRQYSNIKELTPSGSKKELGISIADIAASNSRVESYMASRSGNTGSGSESSYVIIDRYNRERQLDLLDKTP